MPPRPAAANSPAHADGASTCEPARSRSTRGDAARLLPALALSLIAHAGALAAILWATGGGSSPPIEITLVGTLPGPVVEAVSAAPDTAAARAAHRLSRRRTMPDSEASQGMAQPEKTPGAVAAARPRAIRRDDAAGLREERHVAAARPRAIRRDRSTPDKKSAAVSRPVTASFPTPNRVTASLPSVAAPPLKPTPARRATQRAPRPATPSLASVRPASGSSAPSRRRKRASPRAAMARANGRGATPPAETVAFSAGARAYGSTIRHASAAPGNAMPIYPLAARQRGQEGKVIIIIDVLPDGLVGTAKVLTSSGFPLLDEAALDAVRRWRFVPGTRGGASIASTVLMPVRFKLSE